MAKKKSSGKNKANPAMTAIHKKERQVQHQKRIEKFRERRIVRDKLLQKAQELTQKTEGQLRKIIGTLNVNRLLKFVDGSYINAPWYLLRMKKAEEKKNGKTFKINSVSIKKNTFINKERKKKKKKR